MLYLNKISIESPSITLREDFNPDKFSFLIIEMMCFKLGVCPKEYAKINHYFMTTTFIQSLCKEFNEDVIFNLDFRETSSDFCISLLNQFRDILCYPQNIFFNIIANDNQVFRIKKSQRLSDFIYPHFQQN